MAQLETQKQLRMHISAIIISQFLRLPSAISTSHWSSCYPGPFPSLCIYGSTRGAHPCQSSWYHELDPDNRQFLID